MDSLKNMSYYFQIEWLVILIIRRESPGHKKGEETLPSIFIMLKRLPDLPLVLCRPRITIALTRRSVTGAGRNDDDSKCLVSHIFFAVVKVAVHAIDQFAGHGSSFLAVA
jgi:hypothetical protein